MRDGSGKRVITERLTVTAHAAVAIIRRAEDAAPRGVHHGPRCGRARLARCVPATVDEHRPGHTAQPVLVGMLV